MLYFNQVQCFAFEIVFWVFFGFQYYLKCKQKNQSLKCKVFYANLDKKKSHFQRKTQIIGQKTWLRGW